MKRTANIMNVKFNTLFYTALFSGLGVFSFLLLINYAAFPDKVADIFHSVGTLAFFVLAFNVLGYATMRLRDTMSGKERIGKLQIIMKKSSIGYRQRTK